MTIYVIQRGDHWYVDFTANNGQVIAVTETYKSKASALHAANLIKTKAASADVVEIPITR